jgi:hypothetical protein
MIRLGTEQQVRLDIEQRMSSVCPSGEELEGLGGRAGVDDVVCFEPAFAGDADAVGYVAQPVDPLGVGADGERAAFLSVQSVTICGYSSPPR